MQDKGQVRVYAVWLSSSCSIRVHHEIIPSYTAHAEEGFDWSRFLATWTTNGALPRTLLWMLEIKTGHLDRSEALYTFTPPHYAYGHTFPFKSTILGTSRRPICDPCAVPRHSSRSYYAAGSAAWSRKTSCGPVVMPSSVHASAEDTTQEQAAKCSGRGLKM